MPGNLRRDFPSPRGWEAGSALSSPDILFAQNVLLAMAGGATVYSFESPRTPSPATIKR